MRSSCHARRNRKINVLEQKYNFCGRQHRRGLKSCLAAGKLWTACGKLNHFAARCRSTRMMSRPTRMQDKNRIHLADIEDEPENVLTVNESINGVQSAPRKLLTKMNVNGHASMVFQIDTGATCNILRAEDMPSSVDVDRSERPSLCFFNDSKTTALGICNVSLSHESNPHSIHTAKFVVVDKGAASLLGAQSSVKMGYFIIFYYILFISASQQ